MAVSQVPVTQTTPTYPSLNAEDVPFATYNSIRLLWDRIYSLNDKLTAAEATITRLIAAVNSAETAATAAQKAADEALAISQEP